MLFADFTSAVVLISFGAVLGKTSPVQLIIMAFFEVICALINEHIGGHYFGVIAVPYGRCHGVIFPPCLNFRKNAPGR